MNFFFKSLNILVLIVILSPFKCYIFSVIIAVYNTGRYLDDSIGSLLNQTINYTNIQIILVNDGSTDNSEEICLKYQKEYSKNIIYVKIKHSGVSKARNTGLEYAKGEFINFLDADDKWDSQALMHVSMFLKENKNVDIVAGRLLFFEAINAYHPLDYKFDKTRVVNLTKEYNCIHLSGSSSFFRNSLIKGKRFPEDVFTGEDTIFINNILLLNPLMGLIREAIYYYRRRSDSTSAVQNQVHKVDFYFSQLKFVGQYLLDKSKELYNKAVPFIQFYIGYNALFRIISPAFQYLNKTDFIEYCNMIEDQLNQIEDKYILEQRFTSFKNKLFALSKKHKRDLRYDIILKKNSLIYSEYVIMNFKNNGNIIIWKFLEINDNILHLEGKEDFWMPKETYFFYCKIGDKVFFPKYYIYSGYDYITMYGLIEKGRVIVFDIPIKNTNEQVIKIFISYLNNNIEIFPSLGSFTHIPNVKDGYYSTGNYIIKSIERRLIIYRYNQFLEKSFENRYCMYLKNITKDNIIKLRNRNKNFLKFKKKNKPIWIINDKQDYAGDNGEYFFRYLINKNPKEIDFYYTIKKDCFDYNRLKKFGNILDLGSIKYLDIFLQSDKIISSVSDNWVTNPFGNDQKYIKDLLHFDLIFIKNGIIKDDLSNILNRINKNFDLLLSSSKKEYKSFLSSQYGYSRGNVILTGLSRYDNLKENIHKITKEKLILITPTWRNFIRGTIDLITHKSIYSDNFKTTKFYKFYNDFINDEKLHLNMEKFNYTGILCLHPYFSEQSKDFLTNKFFSIRGKCNFQEYLPRASLFVTDYSSIFFDFAYLKKPVIYSQFDIDEFRRYHYHKGYFDYIKDGFGPVCRDIECTVEETIKTMANNCILKKNYIRRIQRFFAFLDQNNNERIFNGIINHYGGKKEKLSENKNLFFFPTILSIFLLLKKI